MNQTCKKFMVQYYSFENISSLFLSPETLLTYACTVAFCHEVCKCVMMCSIDLCLMAVIRQTSVITVEGIVLFPLSAVLSPDLVWHLLVGNNGIVPDSSKHAHRIHSQGTNPVSENKRYPLMSLRSVL